MSADIQKDTEELSLIKDKAKRVASALFLLTNLMPEREPLRRFLRHQATALVSDISLIASMSFGDTARVASRAAAAVESLSSLCESAARGRIISDANALLLRKEMAVLAERIARLSSPHLYRHESVKSLFSETPNEGAASRGYTPAISRPFVSQSSAPRVSSAPARRSAILRYLREHPRSTIKEVCSGGFSDGSLSEKTVQRELVSLIEEGVVRREGERRWSRYFLTAA